MRPAPQFFELWTMLFTHEAHTLPSPDLVSPATALVATVADPLSSASSGYRGRGRGRGRVHGRGGGRGRGRGRAQDYGHGNNSQFHYSPSPSPVSCGGPFKHSTSSRGVLAPSPYHLPAFVSPTPTSTTVICQICDLSGHTALACP
ncbi:PREDICTED: AT-hook motif nuclear-localized protein 4-like [Nicotiana attenuata]|uniref:AT-hook motif nuclear-localized protein 4-like n=1 Tax=Nicotiana attenuata TaxID=49451 RepID=UPI0009048BFA|nr:PREDICTED: AT-hook motif nuclear-localized protein 4-like [Nicotiana attenuata]